ncbi:unnamed protein product [Prorocentrum cordatum]|uniref:Uncharacterized protein n=1 Tax=Prorocentrum cordatum TaxID=2364126 RepID=A0ABN9R4S9_9DINO|nr:unnamed protein product [Polarella glacialis]
MGQFVQSESKMVAEPEETRATVAPKTPAAGGGEAPATPAAAAEDVARAEAGAEDEEDAWREPAADMLAFHSEHFSEAQPEDVFREPSSDMLAFHSEHFAEAQPEEDEDVWREPAPDMFAFHSEHFAEARPEADEDSRHCGICGGSWTNGQRPRSQDIGVSVPGNACAGWLPGVGHVSWPRTCACCATAGTPSGAFKGLAYVTAGAAPATTASCITHGAQ